MPLFKADITLGLLCSVLEEAACQDTKPECGWSEAQPAQLQLVREFYNCEQRGPLILHTADCTRAFQNWSSLN